MGQPPTYDKYWAVNEEGGLDLWGNFLNFLLVLLVLVGLILLYVGQTAAGIVCLGIVVGIVVARYVVEWRDVHSPVRPAPVGPSPAA